MLHHLRQETLRPVPQLCRGATATQPALDLTLDLANETITLTEGVNPPRLLTQGVTIDEDAAGRVTASAPLPPAGWTYLALADPTAIPPPGNSAVLVYDPPEPQVQQLYGAGDGVESEVHRIYSV